MMKRAVKKIIAELRWCYEFIKNLKIIENKSNLLFRLPWIYIQGFLPQTVLLCGINRENYLSYLSDRQYFRLHPINGYASAIIDSKLFLPFLFKDHSDVVPEYYCYISKGGVLPLNTGYMISSSSQALDLLRLKKKLALKKCAGSLGQGFYTLECDEDAFRINGDVVSKQTILDLIENLDQYLITEYAKQHEYASNINNSSANTIRLLCARTNNGNFSILQSFHRFGMKGNVVDNLGSGKGILVFIDEKIGKITDRAIVKISGDVERKTKIEFHPDTKARIAGIQIPLWHDMTRKVISIINEFVFLKYIGLDIVITQDGFKIIEVNSLPDLGVIQSYEPIINNPELSAFFQSCLKK